MAVSMLPGGEADGGSKDRRWVRGHIASSNLQIPQLIPLYTSEGAITTLQAGQWLTVTDVFIATSPGEPTTVFIFADKNNDNTYNPLAQPQSKVLEGFFLWPTAPIFSPGLTTPYHFPRVTLIGGQPVGNRVKAVALEASFVAITLLGYINV